MKLPFGDGTIDVSFPDCAVTVAEPAGGEPVDPREAGTQALDEPHGPPLSARASPGDEVALVVTDITRATPDDVLVDLLLDELRGNGVNRSAITIVIGLGLHRPLTEAEIADLLGTHADLAINHDPDAVVEVGQVDGVPVEIHPAVAEADLVVSTGMVEPHQYAGFSGGAKTVVVGAGGEALIRHTHGPELLGREGVRLGGTDRNPFREFLDRAGDLAGPEFCLNVTHGPSGILDVAAGDPRAVVADLAGSAREALSVPVEGTYDAVVAGVSAPKDANLYQASRAATYVALGDHDPLARPDGPANGGGRIVVPAELPEGAGQGTGERRFHDRLAAAADAATLYEEMKAGYEPGAQRAFIVARVLRTHDVYITNSTHPEVVQECLMIACDSVQDAVEPGSDVLVVPDALNTLLVAAG